GNYTSPSSPSRMDAWSLNELGWVIVTPLTTGGPYTFGPAKPGVDTALFVPVGGSNPRGEYFLLENRQGVLSDGAMIRYHCQVWANGAVRFVLNTSPQSLAVTTAPRLAAGQWGYSYNTVLSAACGGGNYGWSVTAGTPPPGLALSPGGVLSGWPTDTGAYTFQVSVTDGTQTAARGMTLHVGEPSLT